MEKLSYTERLNNFVYDERKRFVSPEKMEAVEQFGLDRAIELWKDGEPDSAILDKLRLCSSLRNCPIVFSTHTRFVNR